MNFALPGHHFGGPQGCQNDAQGTQKGAKMMPGEPKSQENEPRDTQRGTNEKKDEFLDLFAPIWEAILTHVRLKTKKSEKVTAFWGDLEPRLIFTRNCTRTGESRTCKMCQKHSKYAVGCKVGFLQKKSSK